ncbi:MAG: glycoside hydrolase family 125 protein [Vulcanimicrobiaceae bacterium]
MDWRRWVRPAAAAVGIAAALATGVLPAGARQLFVPLTGHRVRPIQARTLFHTLFTDFFSEGDGTTYVQTGDIPAMWLRDSSAQSLPYVRFARAFPVLSVRLDGVIQRDARNILTDPYANAFQADYHVWERKWEVDSDAWPAILAWVYWRQTGNRLLFTRDVHDALRTIVKTWLCEEHHATCGSYAYPYRVYTNDAYDPNTGMIWDAFRPSDDPVEYRFNIPQEMFAVVALRDIERLAIDGYADAKLARQARALANRVETGIERYGRVWVAGRGWMWVYETDGLGDDEFMDDANIPDLTAMPYFGWCSPFDPVYLNTRAFALSSANPWYFSGRYAQGLGSPHTPYGYVWPLGIMARAITATSAQETAEAITTLAETDSKDGLIHESFYPNGYWRYTRAEFGWGNALYAELVFRSVAGFPATALVTGGTVVPFERAGQTPALTPALTQIYDSGLVFSALSDLLADADGRTIVRDP